MNKIIKASKNLRLTQKQKDSIKILSQDLKKIKKHIPEIDSIVVRGGFVVDTLLDCEPKDVDLFYSVKTNNKYSQKCHCKKIGSKIQKMDLQLIGKKYSYDLENSFEKEPRLSPIERTAGFFSYHTDWLSMFCMDDKGEIWTNTRTLNYFKEGVFEVRYQGALPWAYFPKEMDSKDYYVSFASEVIRGVSHVYRRKLKIGEDFAELLFNAPFILKKALAVPQGKRVVWYMKQKFVDINKLEEAIIGLKLKNGKEMASCYIELNKKFGMKDSK